ncbi:calcium-binding protein [Roseomonas sp. HJA6]|uniref:Calcium-binding protein n=1 Tax=Roseomonas alba TaxID=2846776 RepID=A0ABS7AD17_9PROT|nr:calcium-binding protein [Neoroseomonas alba]MBW6400197.1 calcium-binding protein [Neoroseomonas alba]
MAYILGTAAANILNGTAAADVIYGNAGNDRINGLAGDDILIGGLGADTFVYSPGSGFDAIVDGGAGDVLRVEGYAHGYNWSVSNDTDLVVWFVEDADYRGDPSSGVRLVNHFRGSAISYIEGDFTTSNASYGTDVTLSRLYFTPGGTGIDQGNHAEILIGTAQDDLITSGGGFFHEMFGQDGDDTLLASPGTTYAFMHGGDGNDLHLGGDGRDSFRGNRGSDTFDGGGGTTDAIEFRDSTDAVKVDLARTTLQYVSDYDGGDIILNVEQVYGSRWNDTLLGSASGDMLVGRDGRDILNGRAGADTMDGGQDNDIYYVDNAGDAVWESGYHNVSGYDRIVSTVSYALSDSVYVERLSLSGGVAVNAQGNFLSNRLDGNALGNTLSGLNGNDLMFGFAGNDTLLGGEGNDRLLGGAGADSLVGGNGNDRYEWDAITDMTGDRVVGFVKGQDILDLATIDANTATPAYEDFTFIGSAAFTGAGQVRAQLVGGNTVVQVNVNAALAFDAQFTLEGFTGTLAASDFAL